MTDDEHLALELAKHPDIAEYFYAVMAALEALRFELQFEDSLGKDDRSVVALNAMSRCLLAFGDAMDKAGLAPGRTEMRDSLLAIWHRPNSKAFELGPLRAMRTAVAYKSGVRLEASGTKDTPMKAAQQIAALFEHRRGDEAAETVRKSIQRFRKRVRDTTLLRFDPETLTVERYDAETALFEGLPNSTGRPPKKRKRDIG